MTTENDLNVDGDGRVGESLAEMLLSQTNEALWRFTYQPAIDCSLPSRRQAELMVERAVVTYCNDAFASDYGYSNAETVIGKAFAELSASHMDDLLVFLNAYVAGGYRIVDFEGSMISRLNPRKRVLIYRAVGQVEDGHLVSSIGSHRDITEIRRAAIIQDELRQDLEKLLNVKDWGLWTYDRQNGRLQLSDSLCKLLQVEPGNKAAASLEFGQRIFERALSEDDQQRALEAMATGRLNSEPWSLELTFHGAEAGDPLPVEVHGITIRGPGGEVLRDVGLVRDLTEDRQRVAATQKERDLMHAILQTTQVGVTHVTPEGRMTYANPQAEKVLGLSRSRIVERGYDWPQWQHTYFDGRPFPKHEQPFYRIMDTGKAVFNIEQAIRPENGQMRYLSVSGGPIKNDAGEIIDIVFSIQDVSDRVQLERRMRMNHHAVDNAGTPVVWFRRCGRIEYANRACMLALGYDDESIRMFRLQDLDVESQNESLDHLFDEARVAGTLRVTRTLQRNDRSSFFAEMLINHFEYQGEERLFVFITDVTTREAMAERQRMMVRELDHRVKNTLATVMSLAEQTAESCDDVDEFHHRFTGRLTSLAKVHEMLAASKWGAVSLWFIVRAQLAPYIDLEGVEVVLDGPPIDLQPHIATPLAMSIYEMVTNAVKHGVLSNRGGKLSIEWRQTDGRQLIIEWKEQVRGAVPEVSKTGIGLSLVEGLISYQLDGDVSMTITDAGMEAAFTVPLAEAIGNLA